MKNTKAFKNLNFFVLTLSDRASRGEYQDKSGPFIREMLKAHFQQTDWNFNIESLIIPDDAEKLSSLLNENIQKKTDVVITTGGTGIGPRDFTPEIVKKYIEKEIPGIMEHIRLKYGSEKPNALLSRGVAGVSNQTFLYALPGSAKAVKEYMTEILKTMEHLFFMLHGIDIH